MRRGVVENLADLQSLVLGDVVALHDWEDKFPAIQVALQNDTHQWVLAGRAETWSTESLFRTAQEENLTIHVMRRV